MNRALVYELATARFVAQREDALFLGPPGTGKSHLAQAIGRAAIQQGYRVLYREAHTLLEEIADATLDGTRKEYLADLADRAAAHHRRPRHAQAAAHRRRGPARAHHAPLRARLDAPDLEPPVDDWGKLLGDTAAVTALLDRLLHHAHVLKCGPGAGAPSSTPTCVTRRQRGKPHPVSAATSVVAGFDPSTSGRI